jgi:ABC-type antimicrobial peptide transport system permease subunit
MAIGVIFTIAGIVAIGAGIFTNSFVTEQLEDQNITTPGDASIPDESVDDIPTALSMADIIQTHAERITGGLTYAEMGRFAVPDGDPAGTSNPEEALLNDAGNPVPNSARDTALTAASLVTSLSLSALSIGIAYGAILLGIAFVLLGIVIAGLGYALLGLITPEVAERFGLQPVATS